MLVLINNAAAAAKVKVSLKGFANREPLRFEGEQSTRQAFWAKLPPAVAEPAAGLALELPARSVTTLSARL